jgi:hypothetical protein
MIQGLEFRVQGVGFVKPSGLNLVDASDVFLVQGQMRKSR